MTRAGVKVDCKKVDFNLYSKIFHFVIARAMRLWQLFFVIASHRRWRGDPVIIKSHAVACVHYLLDCFAALAMTRVGYVRNDKGGVVARTLFTGLLRYTRNDKGGVAAHDKRGVAGALGVTCIAG